MRRARAWTGVQLTRAGTGLEAGRYAPSPGTVFGNSSAPMWARRYVSQGQASAPVAVQNTFGHACHSDLTQRAVECVCWKRAHHVHSACTRLARWLRYREVPIAISRLG